jgi:Xaa-Pro aminopeptidase
MKQLFTLILASIVSLSYAQVAEKPEDFLSKQFHKDRREKLREKLPANSVAVFFANAVRNRSNDVDYVYHQDPDFYYFTGYKEPNAVLLVFKDNQTAANGTAYNDIIFVQARDMQSEMWNGKRLGTNGVKEELGLTSVFTNKEFKKYNLDFSKFDQVLFFDFQNDVRDETYDSADLYDLIVQFKAKANYPSNEQNLNVNLEPKKSNLNTKDLEGIMNALRGIKTKEELDLIRKAVSISCIGQREVMKAIKPGMSEREIQGIHEFVFKKYQAEDLGYPSIVGAGNHGCILHYIDNYTPMVAAKDMILMDLGAEYRGYTADITRTIPISGKFTKEQKQIYDLVLKAQEEAMKICKPGASFKDLNIATRVTINKGLPKRMRKTNTIHMDAAIISAWMSTTRVPINYWKKTWSLQSSLASTSRKIRHVIKNGGVLLCGLKTTT